MSQEQGDAIDQMMRRARLDLGGDRVHARRWAILAVLCLSVLHPGRRAGPSARIGSPLCSLRSARTRTQCRLPTKSAEPFALQRAGAVLYASRPPRLSQC